MMFHVFAWLEKTNQLNEKRMKFRVTLTLEVGGIFSQRPTDGHGTCFESLAQKEDPSWQRGPQFESQQFRRNCTRVFESIRC